MSNLEKEFFIDKINSVLHSQTSILSQSDIEHLVVLREMVKKLKDKSGLVGIASEFLKRFLE